MSSITQSSTSSGVAWLNTRPAWQRPGHDRLDAAVHMRRGVRVKTDQVRARIGEGAASASTGSIIEMHVDRHRCAVRPFCVRLQAWQTIGPKVRLGT